MIAGTQGLAFGLIAIGVIVIFCVLVRFIFARLSLPPVIGYILMGIGIAFANGDGTLFSETTRHGIALLAEIGLIVLLFRVGLESDLESLARVLGTAFLIFLSNFIVAGALGMAAILLFTNFGLTTALFVGAALSATSVGVSTAVWRDAGLLDTTSGALLVDVAELDDISAVIVISLLFALTPLLDGESDAAITASGLAAEVGLTMLTLAIFLTACYLFTRYIEAPLVVIFRLLDPRLGPMLLAFGVAMLIAAIAELLGFSLAVGAMFAGLAFSSPPTDKLIDRTFEQIYILFSPFFFVSIGLTAEGGAFLDGLDLAGLLLVVAIAGKVIGAGAPIHWLGPRGQAWLFGMSMVPRAEIALVVMSYGLTLGEWAVPDDLYSAMVLVSLATCIIAPVAVSLLLKQSEFQQPPSTAINR